MSGLPELVLMPGLDGSGALFAGLLRAAPQELSLSVLRYPDEGRQDYPALQAYLAPELAARRRPYVLVAESFSGPLALRIGADHPPRADRDRARELVRRGAVREAVGRGSHRARWVRSARPCWRGWARRLAR